MNIEAKIVAMLVLIGVVGAAAWGIDRRAEIRGRAAVRAQWDADKAARGLVEKKALLQREVENQVERDKSRENNRLIQKAHDADLERVRAALGNAPGMRVGPAICGESAGKAEASGAVSSDATDSRGGLVREDVRRDIDALKLRVEEAFAAGRACQKFLLVNGLAD